MANGTVCVYSGYEKRIINALADRFPEYSDSLDAILDRLWDLLPVLDQVDAEILYLSQEVYPRAVGTLPMARFDAKLRYSRRV